MLSALDLAKRLDALIGNELADVARLAGPETWIGPVATDLDDDLHRSRHRLAALVDALRTITE